MEILFYPPRVFLREPDQGAGLPPQRSGTMTLVVDPHELGATKGDPSPAWMNARSCGSGGELPIAGSARRLRRDGVVCEAKPMTFVLLSGVRPRPTATMLFCACP
jgi:hypothetical protein